MSVIHINHIRSSLERDYKGVIELADLAGRPQDEIDRAFLSRAVAAFTIAQLCGLEPAAAAACVTDGFDDNGIDAVYFDTQDKIVYLVQSKWDSDGNSSPDVGSVQKFIQGFKDILAGNKFDRFNARFGTQVPLLQQALEDTNATFRLAFTHTGQQPLSEHAKRPIEDLLTELNDPTEYVSVDVLDQAWLHRAVAGQVEGNPITLEVALQEWGCIQEPILAYYGQIEASDVADWFRDHGQRLFSQNLRKVISRSEINNAIAETLRSQPTHFWYFNNGITVLCAKVNKKPIGGADRHSATFVCEGVSVVNGAQTVGSIGLVASTHSAEVGSAKVLIRFISLEKCPPDFGAEVTRATNTQNRVDRRDFVSLDPEQIRLRRDLLLENGKEYALKTGEPEPAAAAGCSVTEATAALACAQGDLTLAVQAKREIGKLWEDLSKPPYRALFNSGLSALKLWRTVEVLRAIDGALATARSGPGGPRRALAVHANLLVAHLVFRRIASGNLGAPETDFSKLKTTAEKTTATVLDRLVDAYNALYPGSYPAVLVKNATKCGQLGQAVLDEMNKRGE